MPYNPRVQHRYGAYAAQGYEQAGDFMARGTIGAANATAQGIQQRGAGIAAGIESAGSSIASGIQQAGSIWAQNKAMMSQSQGKLEAWNRAGLVSPEEMDAFAKIRDPNKLAGAVAVQEDLIQNQIMEQRQRQNQLSNFALDRIKAEEAARSSRIGQPQVITDPVTGQKQTYIWASESNVIPFKQPQADESAGSVITKHQLPGGESYYTDQNGKIVPASSINKGTGMEALPDPAIEALRKRKAKLEGSIAEGDKYPLFKGSVSEKIGAALGVKSYKEQLAGVNAELGALEKGAGVSGGGQIAAGGDYKSVEDVIAAKKANKISREEAIKILQTQFGME